MFIKRVNGAFIALSLVGSQMISKCDNLRATIVPLLPGLKFTFCLGRLTQTRLSSGKHVIFESGYGLTHRRVSAAQW